MLISRLFSCTTTHRASKVYLLLTNLSCKVRHPSTYGVAPMINPQIDLPAIWLMAHSDTDEGSMRRVPSVSKHQLKLQSPSHPKASSHQGSRFKPNSGMAKMPWTRLLRELSLSIMFCCRSSPYRKQSDTVSLVLYVSRRHAV